MGPYRATQALLEAFSAAARFVRSCGLGQVAPANMNVAIRQTNVAEPPAVANDPALAERLWQESEKIVLQLN
jgi:hypothetical protein